MNLCSDGHDEVCYNTVDCPACLEIKSRNFQIQALEEQRDDLREELTNLRQSILEKNE